MPQASARAPSSTDRRKSLRRLAQQSVRFHSVMLSIAWTEPRSTSHQLPPPVGTVVVWETWLSAALPAVEPSMAMLAKRVPDVEDWLAVP